MLFTAKYYDNDFGDTYRLTIEAVSIESATAMLNTQTLDGGLNETLLWVSADPHGPPEVEA